MVGRDRAIDARGDTGGHVEEQDIFEVIGTQRAMRRLKADPVPEGLIRKMLWAATRAPSGGNAQNWRFVVITNPETKRQLQSIYIEAGQRYGEHVRASTGGGGPDPAPTQRPDPPPEERARNERMQRSTRALIEHMHEAPVIIIACCFPQDVNRGVAAGASIYPAVQNLMLAARALGLGTTLTTIHRWNEEKLRALLGIPETVDTAALIPVGWPIGRFGPGDRKPAESVTYWERWGERRAASD